eukprot:CAMPEP_0113710366 /NCGR_PEP_ID=MMETSP0038_2-20120614/30111_1 /TAXON_ID=2898 /ORGANISM="Cryptomonas paramecium" /LENGTH=141 /DNA_ID=CAMNT_0000636403 /DNA_START=11 /DNA_END=433 /DNA_ORIENTATION=+ /assembly_acc=CAM_ASM_000170
MKNLENIILSFLFVSQWTVVVSDDFISPLRPVIPRYLPMFSWGADHSPLKIPMIVNVFLVNIDYHSNNVFTAVSANDLESILMDTFPGHHPSCIQEGRKLHVAYDLWYHVAHVDRMLALELEDKVAAAMTRPDGEKNRVYD